MPGQPRAGPDGEAARGWPAAAVGRGLPAGPPCQARDLRPRLGCPHAHQEVSPGWRVPGALGRAAD
eukprot:5984285-Lingulodinium_polyedra.AAC.1